MSSRDDAPPRAAATPTSRRSDEERNLRLIIDTIPALAWSARPDGSAEFFSQYYLDYIGFSWDRAKGHGWTAAVHPDDLPGLLASWIRIMESCAPGEAEARLRKHDGEYRWFLFRANPLHDDTGAIVEWYGVNTEIEGRKRAEDGLRESERQFRLLVETIPALVWRGTAEGDLDYLNQRAVAYLGHTAQSLSGGGWLELIHPDHRDATVRRWMHSVTTGASYDDVYRLRRADGQFRWTQSVGEPFRDAEGRITQWYGVIVDIDDRARAEQELRRAYVSFEDNQRLSRSGNFTADMAADDHIWSAELYRIFEFDPTKKITAQAIRDVVHPQDLPAFDEVATRAVGSDFDLLFRIVTRSGTLKHLHAIAHLVERGAGRRVLIGAIQDVTEQVRAEEALEQARAELAHVARLATLSTLTASITHEVNQPLSGIITNAGTCLRMLDATPPDVEGARETARRTLRDGNRATEVIARLRDLFTKKEPMLESLDLNAATREVIAMTTNELQAHRVVLRSDLPADLPAIRGDRTQLQQVVLNLLRNAADAMATVHDRPRQLLITTRRRDDDVVLSVRDAGPGFDPQARDQLFEAFYTTKPDGMGIGLSVSRSIVEGHHGRLWADLNDGPGATFSFSIPAQAF
jgi:PAS domain S-box-containing protein